MKIMISACLAGENCKYSGGNNRNDQVLAMIAGHEIITVCPEVMGGLPTPRVPSEIVNGTVINKNGVNVDREYRLGAQKTLETALRERPDIVVLQSRSPSCGVKERYDGSFSGRLIKGSGVTAELLIRHGFHVIDAEDLTDGSFDAGFLKTQEKEKEFNSDGARTLLKFDRLEEIDFPKLMEIYRESNTENVSYLFPDCADPEAGRKLVEDKFYAYLKGDFFSGPGNCYYVLSEGGVWLSAVRLFPVQGRAGAFYAEALETRPERRREGHAAALFRMLFRVLSEGGSFEIMDSVSKKNTASLRTHEACGFRIFRENSVCVLNGYENPQAYGMRYSFNAAEKETVQTG